MNIGKYMKKKGLWEFMNVLVEQIQRYAKRCVRYTTRENPCLPRIQTSRCLELHFIFVRKS